MAIIFNKLGFSMTFKPWQLFLISSVVKNVMSNPLEGNVIRGFRKEEISETKKKDQKYRRIE